MDIITTELPWGWEQVAISLPKENLCGIIQLETSIASMPQNLTEVLQQIQQALRQPVGSRPLVESVAGKRRVVILVPDHTRPLPTQVVLSAVISELKLSGALPEQLTIVVARGAHPVITPPEPSLLLPQELIGQIPIYYSGSQGYSRIGHTSQGTPVEIDRHVVQADFVLALGNIEPHRMAAFSGGAKAIMPGVASRASIQMNHSLVRQFSPQHGIIEGNLIRQDAEEAARLVGLDFIVNVVLNPRKQVIATVAGDYIQAHRAGCQLAQHIYLQPKKKPAELVIASAGGVPKDHSLYQAVKALSNALSLVSPGGDVVLVAQCCQGIGDPFLAALLAQSASLEDLEQQVKSSFILGYHKAEAILQAIQHAKIHLVWQDKATLPGIRTYPRERLQEVINQVIQPTAKGSVKSVWVLPYAGYTYLA